MILFNFAVRMTFRFLSNHRFLLILGLIAGLCIQFFSPSVYIANESLFGMAAVLALHVRDISQIR
jgi:hypothetical protein